MPILHQPGYPLPAAAPVLSSCDQWTVHEYSVATSTNLVAASLPAWTAVRADTQTAGRGRFQRTWISDRGGLWLSAVVPLNPRRVVQRLLPLAAGLAICNGLQHLGVGGFRLRWPNDVLVNERKLAGLLIDQFVPGLAVVGIGLNVNNQPEKLDYTLRNQTTRLADLVPSPPDLASLTRLFLTELRKLLLELNQEDASSVIRRINQLWGPVRTVELDLDGTFRRGLFTGVDSEGRLLLADERGRRSAYEPHQVRHLTEL